MTAFPCIRAEQLLERRAAGLSTADALRLEEHLAGCDACAEQATWLAEMRSVLSDRDATLSSTARERAISAALRTSRGAVAPTRIQRPWLLRGAAFALAAAAVILLGLALRNRPSAAGDTHVARVDRVLTGSIDIDGRARAKGAAVPDAAMLHSADGATLALAQATTELRPDSRVIWSRQQHVLRLEAGSIVADVDPSAHQRFVVATSRFNVLVLGTRFEVSLDAVTVTRGRVRVLSPDGRELATLSAGQRFVADIAPASTAPVPDATAPVPDASTTPSNAASAGNLPADSAAATATRKRSAGPAQAHADGDALLARARTELAGKRVAAAERALDAALALELSATARAEAMSLRAECALVAGDRGAAVAGYLHVARAFERLPAGETALFAAARIEAERGQHAAAQRWLARYLGKYPHGRFVDEAQARMRELDVRSGPP